MNEVERKNDILFRLSKNEITEDDLMRECCLWACEPECFAHIEVREYPVTPLQLQEYYSLPVDKRYKIKEEFFQQPDIKEYLEMKSKIFALNIADYSWLKEYKKWIPQDKEQIHSNINLWLVRFEEWLGLRKNEVEIKVKDYFEATEV